MARQQVPPPNSRSDMLDKGACIYEGEREMWNIQLPFGGWRGETRGDIEKGTLAVFLRESTAKLSSLQKAPRGDLSEA